MRPLRIAGMAAIVLGVASHGLARPAVADFIQFNSNGTGAPGALALGSFNESSGNAIAVGAVPQGVGPAFQFLFQTTIPTFVDNHGNSHQAPPGNEFTLVEAFQAQIVSITGPGFPSFSIGFVPGGTNYLEIYSNSNSATFANPSLGIGFNTGHLILSGTIFSPGTNELGAVSALSPTLQQFDTFDSVPPPQFASTETIVANGALTTNAAVTFVDPNYFISPPAVMTVKLSTSLFSYFDAISPSQKFVQASGGPGPERPANPGATNGITGPDWQFETAGFTSFGTNGSIINLSTPEPGSLVLLAMGLATLAVVRFGRASSRPRLDRVW